MDIVDIERINRSQDITAILKRYLKNNRLDICFRYSSNFRHTKTIRQFVGKICELFGITNHWKSRFILIVDEMNNNAIEYGSDSGEKNNMIVKVTGVYPNVSINIEVEDTGNGVQPNTAEFMNNLRKRKENKGFTDYHSIRGRGLFMIISRLVDELYFKDSHSGGLIVGIKKILKTK